MSHESAQAAIDTSILRDRISYAEDTTKNHRILLAKCDDSAITPEVTEYWGEQDGNEWRVHIRT